MSNLINSIAQNYNGIDYGFNYEVESDANRAEYLEEALTSICNQLADVNNILGDKPVDISYLLSIQASYLMGIQDGSLDKDVAETPTLLYTESLFPSIRASEPIDVQTVKEGIDVGEQPSLAVNAGYDTEETTN